MKRVRRVRPAVAFLAPGPYYRIVAPVSDHDRRGRRLFAGCASFLCFALSLGRPAGAVQEPATDALLDAYEDRLSRMDRSAVRSIAEARKQFLEGFQTAGTETQVIAFRRFLTFYREVIRQGNAALPGREDLLKALNAAANETGSHSSPLSALAKSTKPGASRLKAVYRREFAELAEYERCGIDLVESEGGWYLQEDVNFVLEAAAPLKGEYHEYLAFHARENRKPVVGDGALMIGWGDLGERISRWERFATAHSSLEETRTAIEPGLARMMSWYLSGTDNSPAYDFSNKGTLAPELLRSYEKFLRDNKNSRHFDLISKVRASLRTSQGRINKDVLALLKSAGYQTGRLEWQAARLFAARP